MAEDAGDNVSARLDSLRPVRGPTFVSVDMQSSLFGVDETVLERRHQDDEEEERDAPACTPWTCDRNRSPALDRRDVWGAGGI
ncbi:MAG: hypothetical protein M3450_04830 [Actinomycetota bacterium]|nr:hypothetical protein [Actinomycetota bacterium]